MNTEYQNCWEFREGRLFSISDPIEGGGDLERDIYACGYRQEASSRIGKESTGADVVLYKNHEPKNGKPLFYIEVMGAFEGIGALVANDFAQLASTMNHLAGLLILFKMDQASAISDLTIMALAPKP